jgi:hypothetical protein
MHHARRPSPHVPTPLAALFACALALLAFGASPARAADAGATFLTWWSCPGDRNSAPGVPFDCIGDGGTVYTLVGTFAVDHEITGALSMDADVTLAFPNTPAIPDFFQIGSNGCNPFAFRAFKGMPNGCVDHVNAFCSGDTNQCDLLYSTLDDASPNVLRLSFTIASTTPVHLAAGTRYFAFALNIPMQGAAGCAGCTTPVAIGFGRGTIQSTGDGGLRPPLTVSGSFPGASACATANDGYSECNTVPVRRTSWGMLKSLYR